MQEKQRNELDEVEVRLEPRNTKVLTYKARAPRARMLQLLMKAVEKREKERKRERRRRTVEGKDTGWRSKTRGGLRDNAPCLAPGPLALQKRVLVLHL